MSHATGPRRAVALVVVLVLAAACSSGDDAAPTSTGTASGTPTSASATTGPPNTAAPTSAPSRTVAATTTLTQSCGTGGDLSRPSQSRTFTTGDGVDRTWLLALPSGYDHSEPAPVVFNLHGAGSNGAEQYVYGNFIEQAERDGALLVMPEALEVNGRPAWSPGEPGSDDDLDFIAELVDLLRSEYCTGSFYAAGMSSGGFMTTALACWADSPFEAFGPVTFAFYNPSACADAAPRPIVYFHGSDDDTVPFDGTDGGLDAAPVTAQEWADHNGCDPDPIEEQIGDEVRRLTWEGCAASTDFYIVDGGGHTWPGSLAIEAFGHTTDQISASDIIWDLFLG